MRPAGLILPVDHPASRQLTAIFSREIVWTGRLFTWALLAPFPLSNQPSTPGFPRQSRQHTWPSTPSLSPSSIPIHNKANNYPHPNSPTSKPSHLGPQHHPPAPTCPPATSRHQPLSKHAAPQPSGSHTQPANTRLPPPLLGAKNEERICPRGRRGASHSEPLVKRYGRVLCGAGWRQEVVGSNRG